MVLLEGNKPGRDSDLIGNIFEGMQKTTEGVSHIKKLRVFTYVASLGTC
jgi:hypothetical protein